MVPSRRRRDTVPVTVTGKVVSIAPLRTDGNVVAFGNRVVRFEPLSHFRRVRQSVQRADGSAVQRPLRRRHPRCGSPRYRRVGMLMFKRAQLYIALALAGLAELIVRAAVR